MVTATAATGHALRVAVEGISKRYGGVHALSEVSLAIRPGTVHALLGENGAGKSTLVKVLSGATQPDAGRILVSGEPRIIADPAEARRNGIAVVHQELSLFPSLTVLSNVYAGHEYHDRLGIMDEPRMRRDLRTTLDEVGWSIPTGRTVGRLTLAQQQMVEIVRAFHFGADLILLDEPNSALTEHETEALYASVRRFRERGQTFLLVSHRLDEVLGIADDVTVLRDGRVVHSGPAAELTVRSIVALMIGDAARQDRRATRQRKTDPPVRLSVTDLSTGPAHDLSFEVREGEVLGFAGLEGSGVTEVFGALFGERRADGGSFTLDGRPFRPRSPADAVRYGLASIPADRRTGGLLMEHPIGLNIALVVLDRLRGRFGLVSDAKVAASARTHMDRLRIRARSERVPAGHLSGGNQQKVVLAKWLEAKPRVLLLNDPLRGIDVGAKAEIRDVILELADSGISVLVWSSEAEELLGMCDRIVVLRKGSVTATLEPASTDRRTLLLAVVGDAEAQDDA